MATRDTYTKVHEEWKDLPDKTTPVLAEDLEHIEQGISDAMDNRALKEIYGDTAISLGRMSGSQTGVLSTSIGLRTMATGNNSLSNGQETTSAGNSSHAEGYGTLASGVNSHSDGNHTMAVGDDQHVSGRYNIPDAKFAEIVGGGDESSRKNIYTLDWQGNAFYEGDVTNGQGVSLNGLKEMIDTIMQMIQPSDGETEQNGTDNGE